jgi:hypothetical protein
MRERMVTVSGEGVIVLMGIGPGLLGAPCMCEGGLPGSGCTEWVAVGLRR